MIDEWSAKRKAMPVKSYSLVFNLVSGDKIKTYVNAKDEIDIRCWLDRQGSSRIDIDKLGVNKAISIYIDKVLWVDIEETQ